MDFIETLQIIGQKPFHMGYLFSNEERKEEMEGRSVENDRLKKELNTT